MQKSDQNSIFNLCFYGDVINKDKTYKSDTCRHVTFIKFLFCEGYDLELWSTLWDMFSLSYDIGPIQYIGIPIMSN